MVNACISVCTHAHRGNMCAYMCKGQRLTSTTFFYCSLLYFLRQDFSLNPELTNWLDRLTIKFQHPLTVSGPPALDCATHLAFTWCWESGLRSSFLHSKHLTWSQSP